MEDRRAAEGDIVMAADVEGGGEVEDCRAAESNIVVSAAVEGGAAAVKGGGEVEDRRSSNTISELSCGFQPNQCASKLTWFKCGSFFEIPLPKTLEETILERTVFWSDSTT